LYIDTDIIVMKKLLWLGDSYEDMRGFPKAVRQDAGQSLRDVQMGDRLSDVKSIASVGPGVEEIRVWDKSGTYRVLFVAKFAEAVYVLHSFQKKTEQTNPRDIKLARGRLARLIRSRK
jgi:phage-related protein